MGGGGFTDWGAGRVLAIPKSTCWDECGLHGGQGGPGGPAGGELGFALAWYGTGGAVWGVPCSSPNRLPGGTPACCMLSAVRTSLSHLICPMPLCLPCPLPPPPGPDWPGLQIPSKFELARMCKATGTTARATFGAPSPDELGFAKSLSVQVRAARCGRTGGTGAAGPLAAGRCRVLQGRGLQHMVHCRQRLACPRPPANAR